MRACLAIVILFLFGCRNSNTNSHSTIDTSTWLEGFQKVDSLNPILLPDARQTFHCPISQQIVHWEEKNVLNPAAIIKDGKVYLLYRAQDSNMTSRIGLAVSTDGLHFTKQTEPILYPDKDSVQTYEWKGGVEDPRIVMLNDSTYLLTYTSYDGKTARLCLASSTDLQHWQKYGPILKGATYQNTWTKSGAIVCQQKGNSIMAVKIDGKYWMYFGDTNLYMATSSDGIHWTPATDAENGKLISVLHPRPGYFDSRLVEPGPLALLRNNGILLIYNGSNAANFNNSSFPKFTYGAGQALFDKNRPYQLLHRTNLPFLYPDKSYEKVGEVNEVCFAEGLVYFNDKWMLYYGTADSKIAVAVK